MMECTRPDMHESMQICRSKHKEYICYNYPYKYVCSDYGNIQFEALVVRLLTEEASQHKRNDEDDIRAAFQALDTDKKGYLEQV